MIVQTSNNNNSSNKYLLGFIMIVINLGGRFIIDDLSPKQKKIINNHITRKLLVFCIFYMATKDVLVSLTLTIVFILFVSELIEEIFFNVKKEEEKLTLDV